MKEEVVKTGRPSHEPTQEHYDLVEQMLLDGATKQYMANSLGIDNKTFCKYYDSFIEDVKETGREKVAQKVAELAKAGDAQAAIFLLKEQQKNSFAFHEVETDDNPLTFLTKIFMNDAVPIDIRLKAAQSALPYKNSRIAPTGVKESKKDRAKGIAGGGGKFGTLSQRLNNGGGSAESENANDEGEA